MQVPKCIYNRVSKCRHFGDQAGDIAVCRLVGGVQAAKSVLVSELSLW